MTPSLYASHPHRLGKYSAPVCCISSCVCECMQVVGGGSAACAVGVVVTLAAWPSIPPETAAVMAGNRTVLMDTYVIQRGHGASNGELTHAPPSAASSTTCWCCSVTQGSRHRSQRHRPLLHLPPHLVRHRPLPALQPAPALARLVAEKELAQALAMVLAAGLVLGPRPK